MPQKARVGETGAQDEFLVSAIVNKSVTTHTHTRHPGAACLTAPAFPGSGGTTYPGFRSPACTGAWCALHTKAVSQPGPGIPPHHG